MLQPPLLRPLVALYHPMDGEDSALLDAYRNGDDEALAALLERYQPAVYRFGVKMCKNPEDAKDVLQDTLLAAARGAREFRGTASFSTWLYAIARSFCIKRRRKRSGEPDEPVPLDAPDAHVIADAAPGPEVAAGDRQLGAALDAAIGALEPPYREVLLLRDVEGLTAPEVATVLGIGVDAVKSRLHRARLAVRERIAPLLEPKAPAARGCPDVVPMLSRYLEGEIGASECAVMERHVADCDYCRARCDSLRRTLSLCRTSAEAGAVPRDVQDLVRTALRQAARERP